MKTFLSHSLFSLLFLCGSLIPLAGSSATEPAIKKEPAELGKSVPKLAPPEEEAPHSRLVRYGERDVVRVKAKLRYTTLIILPTDEQILDFTCGDKEYWVVNGTQNFAYVKPAKADSRTNVNLITASGNVYSFVLSEISEMPEAQPDLKIFVEPKEESMITAMKGNPRFVPAAQIEDYRQQVALAKRETRQAKQEAQRALERKIYEYRSQYPANLKFAYQFPANQKPFLVTAMYHDDRFTYIKASPQETPALYELKDGKPNLINFDYRDGAYVVAKILDSGYLAIGKEKMKFIRKE